MYFIWVNEPNIKDPPSFAFLDLHSAYNIVQKVIYNEDNYMQWTKQLKEPNNSYVNNELNNLQTIATYDRFVEGPEIV